MKKISIIIPVYNIGRFLKDTMESLLKQTYKNIEIILVDDGSVDESPAICDSYAEKYDNVVVIHQENKGVSAARNAGLEKATGELIGFCDGDDTMADDMYEFLCNQMEENDSDIAICTSSIILEDGTVYNKPTGEKKLWDSDGFIKALFLRQVTMAVYTKLFKVEILKGIKFPEGYKTNEDKYFSALAALNAKKISFQDEGKYYYNRRQGSSSITEFSDKYLDCIRLSEKLLDIVKETRPHLVKEAEGHLLSVNLRIYKLIYTRNGAKNFKNEADKIHRYIINFDKKTAKKYMLKGDYIRFMVAHFGKTAFRLFTKYIDKVAA